MCSLHKHFAHLNYADYARRGFNIIIHHTSRIGYAQYRALQTQKQRTLFFHCTAAEYTHFPQMSSSCRRPLKISERFPLS